MTYPERILPLETSPGILALHVKRYEFASRWVEGADVLDVGCGAGYGAALLARRARRVVGVDTSPGALEYARAHYRAAKLEFLRADACALPLPDRSFDLVCAFETIEHLHDQASLLAEAGRVLRPNGTFVASTPRVEATTAAPANPHHRIEFSRRDFEAILRERFASVELYGQQRSQTRRHRIAQRLDFLEVRRRLPALRPLARALGTPPTEEVQLDEIVIAPELADTAPDLVAVCTQPRP